MEVFNQVLLLRQSVLESQMTFKKILSGSGNVLVSAGDLISPYCVIKCGAPQKSTQGWMLFFFCSVRLAPCILGRIKQDYLPI